MTNTERRTIDRAYECIKQHPELGRIHKKDLIPLESYENNGFVRTALVKDIYSRRTIACGETKNSYYEAVIVKP